MIRTCQVCGVTLHQQTGRPRIACKARACQNERIKRNSKLLTQRQHALGLTRTGKPLHSWRKPKALITQRQLTEMANKQWVRDEMFRRGKCAYHMQYFGVDLLVHDDYIEVFEFDHVDRTLKRGREFMVSRLIGRAPLPVVMAEVQLCELVCSNCHQIKTRRNKDWAPSNRVIQEHPQLSFE